MDLEQEFTEFYNKFPRHQKKGDALKAWKQVNRDGKLTTKIMEALAIHVRRREWLKDDGQWVPLPASWLRGLCWEDVLPVSMLVAPPVKVLTCERCPHEPHLNAFCGYCGIIARNNREPFGCSE